MATVHVMPVNDLIEHDNSGVTDCPCGPTTEPVSAEDGSMGWLVTHHSLDGRELHEPKPLPVKVLDPNCPTCQTGPGRVTVGMICQTCGTDYAPDTKAEDDAWEEAVAEELAEDDRKAKGE